MPDRLVRAAILSSDRVNSLSFAAEVFYRRLMSVADDFGRFDGRINVLRAALYAVKLDEVSEVKVSAWMKECQEIGLLLLYSVGGKPYLEILNFRQRTRNQTSKWPCPANDGEPPPITGSIDRAPPSIDGEPQTHDRAPPSIEQVFVFGGGGGGGGVVCAEPPEAATTPELPFLVFPITGENHEWPLASAKLAEYRETYPHLDIEAEMRRARQWCVDNPAKRKTGRGMTKFLFSWLDRSQNRKGAAGGPSGQSDFDIAMAEAARNGRKV